MTPSRSPDALSGLAPLLRVRPELESLCRFGAQWALPHEISTGGWAPFHLVAQGRCVIEVAGTAPIPLETGDVAVLPHGGAHRCAAPRPPRG
jgi:AraC family transcriptional activator of mtrCDE